MTCVRFSAAAVSVTLAASISIGAAPVPKGASKNDSTPDLKRVFDAVGKAVKDEKWPAEADEKLLRGTAQAIFDRMLKAAAKKERKLPIEFDKLTKLNVIGEFKSNNLDGHFLIAGDARVTSARNSVIFASGNVQITGANNCVIVAQNVRCTAVDNSLVVAGHFIRLTSAWRPNGGDGSMLVAGQWIRATGLDGTICHVIRPSGAPSPDEVRFAGNMPNAAIRTNGATGVIYLNNREDTRGSKPDQQTYSPPKNPIAK
jgi:hypothetical protein